MTTKEKSDILRDQLYNDIVRVIESTYRSDGELKPMVFAASITKGQPSLTTVNHVELFFSNPETKSMLPKAMKQAFADIKPVACCLISESWVVKKHRSEINDIMDKSGRFYREGYKVEHDPDKTEAVMISFETFSQRASVLFRINRTGEGPSLELEEKTEWMYKDKSNTIGLFDDLLTEDYCEVLEDFNP